MTSLLLAAAIAFTQADAHEAYESAAGLVQNCTPRDAGTIRARLAAEWLMDRVSRLGLDATIEKFRAQTPDGERPFQNVVVEFTGTKTNAPWIVIMSHYDTKPGMKPPFAGANDGASTSGLLVALAGAMRRARPFGDNVALVWTDGEECRYGYNGGDGFHGSRELVRSYGERNRRVKAAIGLDMLGDRDLRIQIPANVTPQLRKVAHAAAKRAGAEDKVVDGTDVVHDDFSQFYDAGCPAINFIDFDYGPGNSWWHSPEDSLDKISEKSLETAGRVVAEFLNILEAR